jgi:cold shock CspA family protein
MENQTKHKDTMETQTFTGVVRVWDRERGWGFIIPHDLTDDVFVHHTSLTHRPANGRAYLRPKQTVSYTIGDFNGRPVAKNVVVIAEGVTQ